MTNGDKVDPRLFRKKPTYNEILDLIERDEDKVELPERIGVQFFDSFAMGQYKEMLQESAAGTQAVAERHGCSHDTSCYTGGGCKQARALGLHA